uniref:B and T lymphocyte associated n=1 Tax=Molossus molossus TaxID=27622 RepID=A0A7J8HYW7_MOLMO|nr:B and T lymphocyte associated [Molossus molossus]
MKTSPAMIGSGKLCWVLFLIPHLGIWSIYGEKSCNTQLHVKRDSKQNVFAGDQFQLECPVVYCGNRPNVTWCKLERNHCIPLENGHRITMDWECRDKHWYFILYFRQALTSDNGSYRCSVNVSSILIESHSIFVNVAGEQKKPSDTTERGINLVDTSQPFRSEQIEVGARQNSQTLPSESEAYNNDPWFRAQEKPGIHSNPCLEEKKQGIVYASLNHSVIEMNPRQARNVKEAPTEYATICVRS